MKIRPIPAILALAASTLATGFAKAPADTSPAVDPPAGRNRIQLAILLDTSNSMDGLIGQAKTQLWKIVNTFVDARRDGEAPFVEVALYEYGNNDQHIGNHYIRQIEPFTRDLDEISRELFALKTNGGEEYCGAVIRRALADLGWDDRRDTYKVIFIAGNEPFTQGPVDPLQACRDALSKGVVVNTIHCGSRSVGISESWHEGSALAGGQFMIIDQDRAVTHIPAPQDKPIADLSGELNKTYLGYGRAWKEAAAKQTQADHDAAAHDKSGAAVQRAITKASVNYSNAGWDLVDAVREKKIDPRTLDASELPRPIGRGIGRKDSR